MVNFIGTPFNDFAQGKLLCNLIFCWTLIVFITSIEIIQVIHFIKEKWVIHLVSVLLSYQEKILVDRFFFKINIV